MNKPIIVALISIVAMTSLTGLLPSCAAPTPEPAPSPVSTTAPEISISANFTTYTEEGLYSISYPQDWEPALSIMEEIHQDVKERLKSRDISIERESLVFLAGIPTESGFVPNVNVILETLPQALSLDEYIESAVHWAKQAISDYREFSRTRMDISGREVIIIDFDGTYPDIGRFRWLLMVIVDGKIGWAITICSPVDEFDKHKDDFYSILRSFRILK